jgi:signal transduction histidine kinase/CheY-like chemotaxis protein
MSIARETPDVHLNIDDLREELIASVTLLGAAAIVTWLWWITFGLSGSYPAGGWTALCLLGVSTAAAHRLRRRRLRLAALLLVCGALSTVACIAATFPSAATANFFVIPVIFASVLLGQPAHLAVAATACLLVLATGLTSPDGSSAPVWNLAAGGWSRLEELLPTVVVLAVVTAVSHVSARSLYTALVWAWHAYERARENESIARGREAELNRTLKALDEASYRLERTNYMLALARDQAHESRRLKQQFAQTISHELRTPLNLIVGFAELMIHSPEYYGGQLPPAYLYDLGIIYRNACHLQDLVNDVLDLARIEAAQMSLTPEAVDPGVLVQEAVDTARRLVEGRGLALHTVIEADLPHLWVDPTRIRQVLFNLLNNAARFTEQGSVTVSVRLHGEDVVFSVADTGAGIAPADIPRMFVEFHQADGSTRRRKGGAGLGLAISKRFVELHGGRIWLESQVGRGSTFSFSLPVGRRDFDDERGEERETTRAAREPILLAVTPSPSAVGLLTRYVRGCRTVAVPTIKRARQVAQQSMPQVVVIDRACSEIAPGEMEELGQSWGIPNAPIITCPLPAEASARPQLPVDGYLVKPVTQKSVQETVRQFGEEIDRVLVIDGDQDFVVLLSRMLENWPVRRYQVISASSEQEGLAMMRHYHPDLVLLELSIPGTDEVRFIERVRSDPVLLGMPIVAVTDRADTDRNENLQGAMTIVRTNGLRSSELVQWVQNVVNATTTCPAPPVPRADPAR